MLSALDLQLFHALNGWAGRSYAFDRAVVSLTNMHLVKTAPLIAAFCWYWFNPEKRHGGSDDPNLRHNRHFLIFSGLAAAVLACGLSRLIQNVMWERPRPINDPTLGAIRPLGLGEDYLANYSSFPSDNAAMTFALATGLFLIARGPGIAAFLWALLVACLPRVFAGFHYPSDILGGAALGIAVTVLVTRRTWLRRPYEWAIGLHDRRPGLFYAAGFIAAYQMTTFFGDLRELGEKTAIFLRATL